MAYIGSSPSTQSFQPAVDYFSGDGVSLAFTLSRNVSSATQIQVIVNNVIQNPTSAYSVLNNVITFTSVPSPGTNNIYVYYTSQVNVSAGTTAASATAGATGSGGDTVFIQNSKTVNYSYVIPAGVNAMSTGPITISANATVTVSDGSVWAII